MEYLSNSPEQTIEIARGLARRFTGGEVVALNGELGAGKTVFAKGIALGLGVADTVTSPTFTILRRYEGRLALNHLDLYRVTGAEAAELGLEELTDGAVTVVEWAGNAPGLLPARVAVTIEKTGGDSRRITVDGI